MKPPLGVAARIRVGVGFGIVLAGLFSLLATMVAVGEGLQHFRAALGMPLWEVVTTYFITLPVAGVIGGAMARLYRYAWGALLLGSITAIVPFTVFGLLIRPAWPTGVALTFAAGASVVIGGGGCLMGWHGTRPRASSGDSRSLT